MNLVTMTLPTRSWRTVSPSGSCRPIFGSHGFATNDSGLVRRAEKSDHCWNMPRGPDIREQGADSRSGCSLGGLDLGRSFAASFCTFDWRVSTLVKQRVRKRRGRASVMAGMGRKQTFGTPYCVQL